MSLNGIARPLAALTRNGAITLLLITRERLVRADFTSGSAPVLKDLQQRSRPESDDLEMLVDTAIRMGKKRLGKVFVLCSDLWIQTLHMQADMARGLEEQDLARALSFEAEPLSGISAIDSQAGVATIASTGQQGDFWLIQVPNSQVAQVDDVIHEAGGKLHGLLHPAGICTSLASSQDGAWQRVELWPGTIVCGRQEPGAPPQVKVINSEPSQRGWQSAVETWLGDAGTTQWLVPETSVKPPVEGAEVFNLAHELSLHAWLTAWAEHLSRPTLSVPMIRPAPRPMSKARRQTITATLAAVAAIGCYGHYTWNERVTTDLVGQAKVLNDRIAAFTAKKKEATDLSAKVEKVRTQVAAISTKVEDCRNTLDAHRQRWQRLLEMLADLRPEHLVVQKIDSSGETLSISGLCLGPHPANELASELGSRVRELGWQVQPAKQESGKVLFSGDPWKFDLVLTDFSAKIATVAGAAPVPPRGPQQPVNKVASFKEAINDK
jgi:hypothetical protein